MENKNKISLDQILFQRKVSRDNTKAISDQSTLAHKLIQEQLDKDYERLIKPIEEEVSQKLPTELADLFKEFNQKIGNYPKKVTINWGSTDKEELLQELKNNNLRQPKIEILYSYTTLLEPYSKGGDGGTQYCFGFEWMADGNIPTRVGWFLGNQKYGSYDGSENGLLELANSLADALEDKSLLIKRSFDTRYQPGD